mmetsp:Transcript_29324/g.44170  ORF Transcript_29324/g.44170 Transcript_29324/m.44170 type:complete len:97 (+) Transcript_29324:2314-2604(+)
MIKEKQPDMENLCFRNYSRETKDLILRLLMKNPERRITPKAALEHKYFIRNGLAKKPGSILQRSPYQQSPHRVADPDLKISDLKKESPTVGAAWEQ